MEEIEQNVIQLCVTLLLFVERKSMASFLNP